MNAQVMTPNEIRRAGIQVLIQGLGAVGMVRFLQQSETGWGNYTKERSQWLGNPTLAEVRADILRLKQDPSNPLRQRVKP
ncbi:hypothetical protein [Thiothrix winogradskyi]|uniref:Uncharacterized protein n=1 Tax=Thiothrix winogradskyi TaxID=96472 RepID=A0ABY3SU78_9GAMM|nr:hypothetical protein [Thiothrix winogradskyi]UJS23072.1 hypothetical protein L2Y54_14110 [Thiothrix winogradskyi]